MAYAATPERSKVWDPHWNPDILKKELAKKDRSLRAILRDYATPEVGWQGLYGDVRRWRAVDKELSVMLIAHISAVGKWRGNGRNRLDQNPEHDSWKIKFCEEYLKTRNKYKASLVTPYAYSSILCKLDPKKGEYDEKFTEMVDSCDMQLLEWAKEQAYQSLDDAVTGGASPKDRAWIATTIAKLAKNTDWGTQKVDMKMQGTIKFEAQRALLTSNLAAEQRELFTKNREPLMITAAPSFIDAEVVEERQKELVENA